MLTSGFYRADISRVNVCVLAVAHLIETL